MSELKNAKRERFCQEFVKDLNATKAADRAVYKCPNVKGAQLKACAEVAIRIAELQTALAERNEVTQDEIIDNLRESRLLAHENKQISAAVQAEGMVAKVTGNWTDQFKDETEGIDIEAQIKKLTGGNSFVEQSLRLILSGQVDEFLAIAQPRSATPRLVKDETA